MVKTMGLFVFILLHQLTPALIYNNATARDTECQVIDQPLSGRSGYNQKSLCFIPAIQRDAANRRHEDRLAVFTMDEVRLFLISFTLPFKPTIC